MWILPVQGRRRVYGESERAAERQVEEFRDLLRVCSEQLGLGLFLRLVRQDQRLEFRVWISVQTVRKGIKMDQGIVEKEKGIIKVTKASDNRKALTDKKTLFT